MVLNLLIFISFFDSFLLILANEQFHFGIINHNAQWYFHCPKSDTKVLAPPSNDPPLISYECPLPSLAIEILPIEIDFTFLCRPESRLIWLMIDLYQYDTLLSLINSKDIEIKVELNNQIQVLNYTSELNNFTNRFILINAFYIPFESIDILLNKQIEINIEIQNLNQLNQCYFSLKDNYLWQTFIGDNCQSVQSNTLFIQSAKCHFYATSISVDTNLQLQTADEITLTTTDNNLPDFNLVLSIDEKQPPPTTTTTELYDSTQSFNLISTTNSVPYYRDYLLLKEAYHELLALAVRSTTNTFLLKLTFIFLVIILIILIIFFLYMLYHLRSRSSSSLLIRRSSVLV